MKDLGLEWGCWEGWRFVGGDVGVTMSGWIAEDARGWRSHACSAAATERRDVEDTRVSDLCEMFVMIIRGACRCNASFCFFFFVFYSNFRRAAWQQTFWKVDGRPDAG